MDSYLGAHDELVAYIDEQYGISPQHTFADSPELEVFRHGAKGKWFALMMPVKYRTLGETTPGHDLDEYCMVMNVKCEPALVDMLVHNPGFVRAYHMNKTHWMSVFLDGSVSLDEAKQAIDLSYALTEPRKPSVV